MKICSVCSRCFEDSAEVCYNADHGELKEGPHSVDIIPGYRIESVIASSARGVVYHAQQIEYGQSCVISVANADTPQFLSDAKIAAGLFHPGVACIVESGELPEGSCFAVFEEYTGESLREVLNGCSLSLLDQIRIARQVAEAVHAIHSAGLLHGGLRPENVSISGLGGDGLSVKVHNMDLGSAFANAIQANRFSMDSALDSLKYFAPERFRGEAATAQSDVYSLGILLYELLSGHAPFEAASAAGLAEMHLGQKPPEIKIENFDLRMLLTHTLSESLQKQPSFRQSTADLFARQMRHIEQLATHVSTPPPAVAIAMAASSARPLPTRAEPISIAPALEGVRAARDPAPVHLKAGSIVTAPVVERAQTVTPDPTRIDAPLPFVAVPKRSRLKGMKKRVHSYASDAKVAPISMPPLIDWRQPIDDVSPIDAASEEAKLEVAPGPRLIDWQQPENDVPSIDSVHEEAKMELAPSSTFINWKGPEEDVPSIAAVRRDQKEAITQSPTLIDSQQLEDDVPSIDALRDEVASSGATVAFEVEEEIPEVRMPARRIEVKWGQAIAETGARRPTEAATNRIPNLLAISDNPRFLGYQPRGRDVGKLPIYGVALFALLIVGFGVVRLGTALADDSDGYIGETRTSRIEIPAAPIETAAIKPQTAVLNIPAQAVNAPAPVETSSEEPSIAKGKVVETIAPSTSKPSRRSASDELRTAAPAIKPSSVGKDPFVPSTLVITRGSGKPKAVVVKENSATEPRPAKVGSGATRPRIVSLPN